MGAKQQFTAPYTPQENLTERANRTGKTMIAQFAGQNQRNWDEKWPEIMLAVNTSVSESTGHTSSFITQVRETLGLSSERIVSVYEVCVHGRFSGRLVDIYLISHLMVFIARI